jgi:predicted transcriptional regulator
MQPPEGRLTPAQYEILEAIWDVGPPGATGLQIWERISKKRNVVISTTINLVNRLEARGWLNRVETDGPITFWPTLSRDQIEANVAEDFVECFFGGSASQLIMSLFGREKISPEEVQHLRKVYDKQTAKKKPKRSRKKSK